ncbi:hypothetical protein HDV00_007226 [Rhizophlyctis rosea]|nr:hypothetical protein HDV00_007226 [Rhizophlyctis rosea]
MLIAPFSSRPWALLHVRSYVPPDAWTGPFPLASLPPPLVEEIIAQANSLTWCPKTQRYRSFRPPPTISKWWYSNWQRSVFREIDKNEYTLKKFLMMLSNNPHVAYYIEKATFLPVEAQRLDVDDSSSSQEHEQLEDFDYRYQDFLGSFVLYDARAHLAKLPSTLRDVTILGEFTDVSLDNDTAPHLCPILARAVRNVQKLYIHLPFLCCAFFTSADLFPNMEDIFVHVQNGCWDNCDSIKQWREGLVRSKTGWNDFRETGLNNRHKMPKMKRFEMADQNDLDGPQENYLDGMASYDGGRTWERQAEPRPCELCQQVTLKLCRCRSAYFCRSQCRNRAWKDHKAEHIALCRARGDPEPIGAEMSDWDDGLPDWM